MAEPPRPARAAAIDPALAAIFGDGGALARAAARLPLPRAAARDGAGGRATRSHARGQLVAEAGTGTGKTFAYLVPALLYGGKVIVSTGTKTLQDQLFERDLPLVRDALARARHHRAAQGARELRVPAPPASARRARSGCPRATTRGTCARSSRFARASDRGDRGAARRRARERDDLAAGHLHPRQLPRQRTAATTSDCFVMKARKEALEADVVVVNHHLFFADVMLRDEGVAELLPACNTVILDEAHQLPDTATLFFGEQITAGQLAELARDAEVAARTKARDVARAARRGGRPAAAPSASCASPPASCPASFRARRCSRARTSRAALDGARRGARPARDRARPVRASAARRSATSPRVRTTRRARRARALGRDRRARRRPDEETWIRWVDVTADGWQLQASPLSVAPLFRRQLDASARAPGSSPPPRSPSAATSRTTRSRWASTTRATGCWDSPFDYATPGAAVRAARPAGAQPAGAHRGRGRRRAAGARGERRARLPAVHHAARARPRARTAARGLRTRRASTSRCWCRAKASKTELLERFRALGNAVLLGSASFWEGRRRARRRRCRWW